MREPLDKPHGGMSEFQHRSLVAYFTFFRDICFSEIVREHAVFFKISLVLEKKTKNKKKITKKQKNKKKISS